MPTPASPWERVYQQVKMTSPGVIDAVLQQELYRCFKDFADQTNIWTEEVPLQVTPQELSYPFTLQKQGMPNRLLLVYDPANASPDKRWVQQGISMQIPGTIVLATAPSTATTWNAIIAKTLLISDAQGYPGIDADSAWIVDMYQEAFYFGTLSRLQMQPTKTYSNPKLGDYNNRQYIAQRSKARADVNKAHTWNAQRWQFPQGFATTARKGWT